MVLHAAELLFCIVLVTECANPRCTSRSTPIVHCLTAQLLRLRGGVAARRRPLRHVVSGLSSAPMDTPLPGPREVAAISGENRVARKRKRPPTPRAIGDSSLVSIISAEDVARKIPQGTSPEFLRETHASKMLNSPIPVEALVNDTSCAGIPTEADSLSYLLCSVVASHDPGAMEVEREAVLRRIEALLPRGVRLVEMQRGDADAWRSAREALGRARISAMLAEDGGADGSLEDCADAATALSRHGSAAASGHPALLARRTASCD
jgi:hypothetical protein